MGKRIYPLNLIMHWYCYDIEEICRLYKDYNLHPQTVRNWIRDGLLTIDKGKPALIYGDYLKDFLGNLNTSSKCKTEFEQMFCFGCKQGKSPHKRQIKLEQAANFVRAKAICCDCKNTMNKSYKIDDIPKLRTFFHVVDVLQLDDCEDNTVKTHIPKQCNALLNESPQMEFLL